MKLLILACMSTPLLTGCKPVECGPGTIESEGECVPADEVIDPASCGPGTVAAGGQCVPEFGEVVCDPETTEAETDPITGIVTCIGTAAGFACPQPDDGKMTICGQVFDLETGMPFSDGGDCTQCPQPGAGTGTCSIGIRPVDAVRFANNPMDPGAALVPGAVFLDTCGRYRVENIPLPNGPLIGLGIDDATAGPGGTTNSTAVATPKQANVALKDFEAFIVRMSTTNAWAASQGPAINGGIFVAIFRAMSTGTTNQAGVQILKAPGTDIMGTDHYFVAADAVRTTIDDEADVTGANGTALVTGAVLGDAFTAAAGAPLPAECAWGPNPGVTIPFVVLVQIFRPVDGTGTCPR